jgi:hypothetical protein
MAPDRHRDLASVTAKLAEAVGKAHEFTKKRRANGEFRT